MVAGVDPTSLGVVRDPGSYGADLACGELQPLGQHQTFGGSAAGFLSCRLDEALLAELPNIYISAVPTVRAGEFDFFWGNFESTSYATRGESDDVIGCGSTMAGIIAATYLSLMGPAGMAELGEALRARAQYLRDRLATVPGVGTTRMSGLPFKEVIVDFSGSGRSPAQINAALLERRILGGIDLGEEFPELAGCALYSVSEEHTREDLDHSGDHDRGGAPMSIRENFHQASWQEPLITEQGAPGQRGMRRADVRRTGGGGAALRPRADDTAGASRARPAAGAAAFHAAVADDARP